ncbi:hypothetical protein [Corynebacterium bovis]|uniref:hypothetical protein n=1 Tax=Corynebacterium bovis TaxID=36808 RepID=UPI000F63685A|nr:hypothetical protein [Corynebacterium bovis]RRO98202.1 hypothetical protein CXF32_01770 [Corynebacterium bovis]RRQ00713.1 hypothetical protein CXF31_00315 [Corynebacterium bovis]RRQ06482.1 hypothetical protein CXF43_08625 [Corynebacterium bovis]RRQ09521.1 hypothetical protein CXF44_07755 [Corynebacterium bovis]
MPTTQKDSRNLSARQRARLATEEHQRKLKTRQKTLAKVFSALDARDEATLAAGQALAELKKLGGTNATIADEIGLDTRDVSALLRHATTNTDTDTGDEYIDDRDRDTNHTPGEPETHDRDEQDVSTSRW